MYETRPSVFHKRGIKKGRVMNGRPKVADSHLRHLALQIAAQLPEDTPEAIKVLEYARKLLMQPLDEVEPSNVFRVFEGKP